MSTSTRTRDESRLAFEVHLTTCTACRIDVVCGVVALSLCAAGDRLLARYAHHSVVYAATVRQVVPALARRAATTTEALRQYADAQERKP